MSSSLTNENKNSVSMTLESKDTGLTWGEADFTWADGAGTWAKPGTPIVEETKNSASLTLETKN